MVKETSSAIQGEARSLNVAIDIDWDLAYSNVLAVANSADYPPFWLHRSQQFCAAMLHSGQMEADIAYGESERSRYDLFFPENKNTLNNQGIKGLVVYVHGGYWMKLDKSFSSYLAKGAVEQGFAVAVLSYPLCPDVLIGDIVREVAAGIQHAAAKIDGPIYLTGHSAGGQIVSRMGTKSSPLDAETIQRIRHIVSISGLSDLRPLMKTEMNAVLRLDACQAYAESPALLEPICGIKLTAWVGAEELPEFIRQSLLHTNIWSGFDCSVHFYEEKHKHHLNIMDGLSDPEHILTKTLLEIT